MIIESHQIYLNITVMQDTPHIYSFNPEETKRMSEKPLYNNFKRWLLTNGVLLDPSIVYPAYFGEKGKGVIGVATSQQLPGNKAVIAVPYDLIITLDKVKQIQELNQIIIQNPTLLKYNEQAGLGILSLYLCYEMIKKEKSFYWPYFAVADDVSVTSWSHAEMLSTESPEVIRLLNHQKQEMESYFMSFLSIFRRYPHTFPQSISNTEYKVVFEKAYNFICTRAFGWYLPSISLIPMADSLNHNNHYVKHMLINVKFEIKPHPKYTPKNQKIDLRILNKVSEAPLAKPPTSKSRKSRRLKFIEKHKEILGAQQAVQEEGQKAEYQHNHILLQQYNANVRNMRQLHFYQSSCSQDNDTDEESIEQFEFNLEKFKLEEKYESLGLTDKTKKQGLMKYWKMFVDNSFEDMLEDSQQQEQSEKRVPSKQKLHSGQQDSEASSLVSSTSSQEDSEEQFQWLANDHQNESHQSTYFIMSTHNPVGEHEQLYNFYGRRSNRFLLVGYNFVLDENKYDSFPFRILLDLVGKKKNILVKTAVSALIYRNAGNTSKQIFSREIRVKKQRVCMPLINHCRALLIGWTPNIEQKGKAKILIPFNIEFETKVLKLAEEFIKTLCKNFSTSLEEDEEMLELCHKHEMRMAIKIRMSYREILERQLKILNRCQEYLKNWKKGKLRISGNGKKGSEEKQMKWVRKVWGYLKSLERSNL